MMLAAEIERTGAAPALAKLRAATQDIHHRLDHSLDIVARLTDPAQRRGMISRYAAFHIPAEDALGPHLQELADLDFSARSRAALFACHAGEDARPAFPVPGGRAEALGMLYVLEGSTLGGRMILRTLAARGVADPALGFLDPYGTETGARWRDFLAVLCRELADDRCLVAAACDGAVRGFAHAEKVLSGREP